MKLFPLYSQEEGIYQSVLHGRSLIDGSDSGSIQVLSHSFFKMDSKAACKMEPAKTQFYML